MQIYINSSTVGANLRIRPAGAAAGFADDEVYLMVASKRNQRTTVVNPVNGEIDYCITTGTALVINMSVVGWFL